MFLFKNPLKNINPTIVVSISVIGNVSQKLLRPNFEKKYPRGTNSITVLITVSIELLKAYPTDWKKTGKINDVTSGKKLIPIIFRPYTPICITLGLFVKTESICCGIIQKQAAPTAIKEIPKSIEVYSVFLHLSIFFAP